MKQLVAAIGMMTLLGSAAHSEESPSELRAAIDAARAAGQTHPLWVERLNWIRKPNGDDLFETYPSRAKEFGVRGAITLICRIGDHGELKLCIVDREEPSGKGFGEAALNLSRRFRMKDVDEDGMPVAGRLITIPIRYGLG